jgi:hypothetical protein
VYAVTLGGKEFTQTVVIDGKTYFQFVCKKVPEVEKQTTQPEVPPVVTV